MLPVCATSAQIVAQQIDDHQVFGSILWRCPPEAAASALVLDSGAARAGVCP